MEFEGKVVLITGAGSGIGAGAARAFASKGATLSLIDINGEWLKKIEKELLEIMSDSKKLLISVGDLLDEKVREKFVSDSAKHFGQIDVLLNVAGLAIGDSITDFNLNDFKKTIDLNLVAPFHLSALSSTHLAKTKGCILNISSSCSDLALNNMTAYCVSKAGVDSLTKCLAVGLGPQQVRVNSIRPGCVATNIFASQKGQEVPRSEMEYMNPHHIVQRIAEPSEIGEMLAFMASDKCAFMTGTNLLFDGGYNALRTDIASGLVSNK